jgi:AcrR family transcriptional regulator
MARAVRADALRNRDRLIEEASAAFAERGVDASLEDIARRAEVGIGTLYRHFPTRAALVEAVFRQNVDALCDGGHRLLESETPEKALAEWMLRFVTYVTNKRGLAEYLKSVAAEDSELFQHTHRVIDDTIQALLTAAKSGGGVRADVEASDLLSALSGVCLAPYKPGGDEQSCRIIGLLVDGMRYQPVTQ